MVGSDPNINADELYQMILSGEIERAVQAVAENEKIVQANERESYAPTPDYFFELHALLNQNKLLHTSRQLEHIFQFLRDLRNSSVNNTSSTPELSSGFNRYRYYLYHMTNTVVPYYLFEKIKAGRIEEALSWIVEATDRVDLIDDIVIDTLFKLIRTHVTTQRKELENVKRFLDRLRDRQFLQRLFDEFPEESQNSLHFRFQNLVKETEVTYLNIGTYDQFEESLREQPPRSNLDQRRNVVLQWALEKVKNPEKGRYSNFELNPEVWNVVVHLNQLPFMHTTESGGGNSGYLVVRFDEKNPETGRFLKALWEWKRKTRLFYFDIMKGSYLNEDRGTKLVIRYPGRIYTSDIEERPYAFYLDNYLAYQQLDAFIINYMSQYHPEIHPVNTGVEEFVTRLHGPGILSKPHPVLESVLKALSPDLDDDAMMSDVGGIDFNPNNLNLKQQGQEIKFDLPAFDPQNIQPESINGILPVIINIIPVTNFPLLLGLVDQEEDQKDISFDSTLDPMDTKERFKMEEHEQVSLLN